MKGYPKSRFDIINQTQIQEIDTATKENPVALYMMPYTSNKGTEEWELMYGFDGFTDAKGGISFNKHGQGLLSVAQALRAGAYVLGKRMVSNDAALANVTVRAKVVKVESVSYLYLYTKSGVNCNTFEDACKAGYGDFDAEAEDVTDVPLFTVAAMGRGESLAFFRLNPEYASSRSKSNSDYTKYSFEVMEGNESLESIMVTMNPEIIIDGEAQAINPKIKAKSKQVRVKLYEDGVYKLVGLLAETAVDGSNPIAPAELINLDFINGYNRRGDKAIGGIVTIEHSKGGADDEWVKNKPAEITKAYSLIDSVGIPLVNGSYGKMGVSPITNAEEYKKMLLGTFGKDTDNDNYDSIIYDLDAYKIDAVFDCDWPMEVKNAVVDLADFRGDFAFLSDLGTKCNTLALIKETAQNVHFSNYVAMYHNYFKIIDPFTRKEIQVTMPYKLIDKLADHIVKGCGRPFAGILHNIEFDDIIDGSVNYYPVQIPGQDQKQELVDINVNYLGRYDGVPVMETMYVNDNEYSQLSFLSNIMAVQEIIKIIRTRCPRTRYTFLEGEDLDTYIADVQAIIKEYSTNFRSITCEYMADEKYEQNNIFYAVLKVQFKNFIQEEYFKIYALS